MSIIEQYSTKYVEKATTENTQITLALVIKEIYEAGFKDAIKWAASNVVLNVNGEACEEYHVNNGFIDAPIMVDKDSILMAL